MSEAPEIFTGKRGTVTKSVDYFRRSPAIVWEAGRCFALQLDPLRFARP